MSQHMNLRIKLKFPLILGFLVAFGMYSNQLAGQGPSNKMIIEMTKGACFGSCPVYSLKIYENGLMHYEGIKNVERLGLFAKQLSKAKLEKVKQAFLDNNFWYYRSIFKSEIPDAATVSLTYIRGGVRKTVLGKDNRPLKIKTIEDVLTNFANSKGGWSKKRGPISRTPENVVPNEMIVQLVEGTDPNLWMQGYEEIGLFVVKKLGPESPYLQVSFDAEKITLDSCLEKVRADAQVVSADYNRIVPSR